MSNLFTRPRSLERALWHGFTSTVVVCLLCPMVATAQPPVRPDRGGRPGPWDHDVLVLRVAGDGTIERLGTFARAGVPTLARLRDGRLIAAHQHFPADDDAGFDKVAVRFSTDEGRNWSDAKVIALTGLPPEMKFPFDPTLVPLPDGRIRLYFTSLKGRPSAAHRPAIYSALSRDGLSYEVEPGVRFEIDGRPVIDCAVTLHNGLFHLFAPDNGSVGPGARPADGVGYHAVSKDGLQFERLADVKIDGRRHWLGGVVADGDVMRFFGSGAGGIWTASSRDGKVWQLGTLATLPGADPGVVRLNDGGWLVVATGAPRPGTPSANKRKGM